MEEKRLLSKDEVYFLVFFSNSFIGSIILSGRYHFDSIRSFFIFAGEEPFPFTLFFLVFFCCLYYFFKILYLIFDYPHKHYTFKHFEI